MSVAQAGTIVRLVKARGFGFIRSTDGREWFFHRENLITTADWEPRVEIGAHVTFDTEPHATKGPRAINITIR